MGPIFALILAGGLLAAPPTIAAVLDALVS